MAADDGFIELEEAGMTLKLITGAAVAILSAVFGGATGANALAQANSAPMHAQAPAVRAGSERHAAGTVSVR